MNDPGTTLDIAVAPAPHGVRVALAGELDLSTVPALRRALGALPPAGMVELDLGRLAFCDSQGLRTLIDTAKATRARGADFAMVGVQGEVAELLRISGVGSLLGWSAPPA